MKVNAFTDKHSMADHRLILHPFCYLATEDCVVRSFQRLLMIDLSKDAHDCLVVHLRRLEDCMDDRFIRKHNGVGERLLEGTLRRTDGLGADSEWIQWIRPVSGMFEMESGVVGLAQGEERWNPWSMRELGDWVK